MESGVVGLVPLMTLVDVEIQPTSQVAQRCEAVTICSAMTICHSSLFERNWSAAGASFIVAFSAAAPKKRRANTATAAAAGAITTDKITACYLVLEPLFGSINRLEPKSNA